jgi:hypothetical protein
MLFMILVLGSIIMMTTSLAGLLMVFELRQVADAQATGAAIFAADTGIECVLFQEFGADKVLSGCPAKDKEKEMIFVDSDGREFKQVFKFIQPEKNNPNYWLAVGTDGKGRATRALEIRFKL